MIPVKEERTFSVTGKALFPMEYITMRKRPADGLLHAVVRINGTISYSDAFGKRHHLPFRTGTTAILDRPVTMRMRGHDQPIEGVGADAHVARRGDEEGDDDEG
jgi:hypothetical protein